MATTFIGEVSIAKYLATGRFKRGMCDSPNYEEARPCNYDYVQKLYNGVKADETFAFISTEFDK